MKKISLTTILIISTLSIFSQTYFEGGIYNDAVWALENSPYILTGDVVLFPGKTLTIEPGVEIRFDDYYILEIRGILVSIGIPEDRIVYTSNKTNPSIGDWDMIHIRNDLGAKTSFEYCDFSFANYVGLVECCNDGGPLYFRNCLFENNNAGIYGYTGYEIEIDSCEFTNNVWGIVHGDKTITNTLFFGNEYGIHSGEEINIRNSVFQENDVAIYGGRGLIDSCIIENNNIGFVPIHQGFELRENDIVNNGIGVQMQSYDGEYALIINNRICNNSIYNVENLDEMNKELRGNCWCISDSTLIEEKIYDGYDNIDVGLFNFDIFNENCDTILKTVIKFSPVTIDQYVDVNDPKFFPNPFSSSLNISLPNSTIEEFTIIIYNIYGQEVVSKTLMINETNLALDYLKSGIYYCTLNSGDDIIYGGMII